MKKNLISIIIPYHRKKKYFQQTIHSIAKQSYKNYEVIIIFDDASLTDLDFVKKAIKIFKNKKLIINKKNIGAGLSRNKGIKFSRGNYISFCDADDLWDKNKLRLQLEFMKKNQLSFSHSSYKIIDQTGKRISSFIVDHKIDYSNLIKSCDIGLSTVMCEKKILKNMGFADLKTKEDYFLWLKLINKIKVFHGIKKELVSWRKLKISLSSSNFQKILDAFRLYSRHSKNFFVIPLFYTLRLSFYALIKKLKIYR